MQAECSFHAIHDAPRFEARYVRDASCGFARLSIGPITINFFAEDLAGVRERFRDLRAALDRAERDFLDYEAPALTELQAGAIEAAVEADEAAAEFTARRIGAAMGSTHA